MEDVALEHGISAHTGERWRHEGNHFGDAQRVRKKKAREKGTKLGRPFTVPLKRFKPSLMMNNSTITKHP